MKIRHIILASVIAGASAGAFAQAKEQFFPLLSYRTGAYAPNGTPWPRCLPRWRRPRVRR